MAMADGEEPRVQTLGKRKHMETEEDQREEMEIEKLKSELQVMAQRVINYRKTVPDLLTKVLSSHVSAQRPMDSPLLEVAASSAELQFKGQRLVPEDDEGIKDRLRIFRERSERNLAAMPDKLKRLKECIHKLDQIGQTSVNLHPILNIKF